MDHPLAFVDIETTGSSVTADRIIEIGILRVDAGDRVTEYKTLLNPHTHIPPFILEMTGISPSALREAPDFRDVMQDVYELLEDCIFVAHNARFDYAFIRNEFKRQDYTYSAKVLCTVKLSRLLFPHHNRHNLDSIIQRFGIACENRHRAFDDARVLWDFYRIVRDDHPHLPLEQTVSSILRQPSLPDHLGINATRELPDTAGVYLFYGEGEVPLYIGKSRSIRSRVLSHFSGDNTSTTELMISQQVRRIETISTAGELGALILEARLIKEQKPLYNRRLRSVESLTAIRLRPNTKGYLTAIISENGMLDPDSLSEVLFIAPSRGKARDYLQEMCEKHGLCPVLLGLEKGTRCFDAKLGKCTGVCSGDEPLESWNARFLAAFQGTRIPEWPFSGPVLVREIDPQSERTDIFLFDRWCALAKIDESDLSELQTTRYEYHFDPDTYKILRKFLTKKRINGLSIYPVR
ncbi:MAG: exonuclease domain-containing protein [Patescibacteria group bacterium]|nr:exonuclease domain-containing protein [Patescibacteria group bacterium]